MKLSIFTPTHDPKFLSRLYESLKVQTYKNWEWVIVPNGEFSNGGDSLMPLISDKRIKIIPSPKEITGIGGLKKFACEQCTGEVLVEVDHDDELFPTCLAELAAAFQDGSIDFVYSNCCEVREGYKPNFEYTDSPGWKYRLCRYRSHTLKELVAFAPDPRSVSKIWYAPNHVRSWRRSFYEVIGGHNEKLEVLDDQDLMCRTYIAGNMHHIDKPLYVYHVHENNTCYSKERFDKIQVDTLRLHDFYIEALCLKWCNLNGLRAIDLCGGHNPRPGFESVDLDNADIICDLNGRWDFRDETIGLIRASDALEHLRDPIHVMKEAYRVLAPNGWFLTNTPSTDGRGAFQDPTHVSFWNSNSFWYYTRHDQARFIDTPVKFQLSRILNYFPSEWHKIHNIPYVKADLVKYAGRTPGPVGW